jgi:hypothetical protein
MVASPAEVQEQRDKKEAQTQPPMPPRLTREERLELENITLKVENIRLQQERLKLDFDRSKAMLLGLQKESFEMNDRLNKKYGVDLAASDIQSDGTIVPKGVGGISRALSVLPQVG